jgi:hypothetical protein
MEEKTMANLEMNRQRLAEIVEAFGASPERWPAAERQAAEALVARSAEARALVAQARELDALLDMAPAALPTSELAGRIMAARPAASARPVMQQAHAAMGARRSANTGRAGAEPWRVMVRAIWPYGSPAVPAGALAFSVMLGLTLGLAAPSTLAAVGVTTATTTASAASGTAGDQLVAMALVDNEYPEEWKK